MRKLLYKLLELNFMDKKRHFEHNKINSNSFLLLLG